MLRRALLGVSAVTIAGCALAGTASASTIRLYMGEGPAFATLGHSCGASNRKSS